jgi:cytochrome c
MKIFTGRIVFAVSSALLLVTVARAADTEALARKMRCNACHDAVKALIGPPWRAIALRYQADKQKSVETLVKKVISGGGGSWGVVPMVPNEHVSEADARTLVEWILNSSAR